MAGASTYNSNSSGYYGGGGGGFSGGGGNYLNMADNNRFAYGGGGGPASKVLIRTILLEQIVGMERLLLLFYLKRVLMHPQLLLNPSANKQSTRIPMHRGCQMN